MAAAALALRWLGAGAAFVVAAGLKASGAVLIPVVLAGLLSIAAALVAGARSGWCWRRSSLGGLSLLAFGLHIPDLSTQCRLVTSESVPEPDRARGRRAAARPTTLHKV